VKNIENESGKGGRESYHSRVSSQKSPERTGKKYVVGGGRRGGGGGTGRWGEEGRRGWGGGGGEKGGGGLSKEEGNEGWNSVLAEDRTLKTKEPLSILYRRKVPPM